MFFISKPYKEQVVNRYSVNKKQISIKSIVIPNGVDSFWLDNKYIEKNMNQCSERFKQKIIKIIYAGDIDRNKNLKLTVKAKKLLESKGWKVSITAIGNLKDKRIFDHLSADVVFKNKMPKEELIKRYRDADIFVMPSHMETFGLVYAEAMSQGLPVLYTKGQGFDGQFDDGLVGYPVDDKDFHDLASALTKVTENYEKLSSNCLKNCTRFDWKLISRDYYKAYSSMLADGRKQ